MWISTSVLYSVVSVIRGHKFFWPQYHNMATPSTK